MPWYPFDNGATIGQRGSEDGIILRDQEHDLGARITLERDCANNIPFAVTCGIYGCFFHTRFASSEQGASFAEMSDELTALIELLLHADDPDIRHNAIKSFVDRFQ